MTGHPQNPLDPQGCWGGFKGQLAWCEKKPRPGCLTCWWHRDQESAARTLQTQKVYAMDEKQQKKLVEALACLVAWYGCEDNLAYVKRLARARRLLRRIAPEAIENQDSLVKSMEKYD